MNDIQRLHRFVFGAGLLHLFAAGALAAQSVPTPREHFGFDLGADRKLASWTQLTAYFEKLARGSPRVKVDTLGKTTKGLPFVMLTITSPENHARLDELRSIQLKLSDPRTVTGSAELQRLLDAGRTVVLITHGIHATEVGGVQSAGRLAHRLASSNDPRVREILDNVILLQIPSLNPDGAQWVADWYMKHVGTEYEGTDPPWLYQFYTGHDNNRDWYAFTQKETQHTIQYAHNAWHPQIVHDIHQMGGNGARIFVPPYIDPVEPNVDPAIIAALNQLGAYMAAELTAQGKAGVVLNGIYDAFSPARSYQHYHGGVRILSETASAELATPVQVAAETLRGGREYDAAQSSWKYPLPWTGGEWGLPHIVDYMESGALALLTNAAKNRRFWLENFYNVNRRATERWASWPAAWVIPADQANAAGLSYALRILTMSQVEIGRAAA
ncbi:MAG: M14 family metallopeptidase, partial [Longimicrobiales bacterium]